MKSFKTSLGCIGFMAGLFGVLAIGAPEGWAMLSPHPRELYDRGMALVQAYRGEEARLTEAQGVFVTLIEKFPESPLGYLGMSHICRIDAYLYGNHYNMDIIQNQALPLALKAMELGPSLRDAHENYAIFEHIFSDYQKDQALVKEYLHLFPDSAQTFYAVANFMRDQNNYEQALEFYGESLNLGPSQDLRFKILKRLGLLYLKNYGQPQQASDYFREALDIRGDCPVVNEYLGVALLQMKQYRPAIERLRKSVALMPRVEPEYFMWQAQGLLSEQEGRPEEAIRYLEKALSYKKQNSALHYSLGNLYYKLGKFEDAYSQFKMVVDLSPQNSRAYYYAGRSAHLLGKKDLAIDYYRKCLQLDAESQEAEWIRKNISDISHK